MKTYKIYLDWGNERPEFYGLVQAQSHRESQAIGRAIADHKECKFISSQVTISISIQKQYETILINRLEEIRESLKDEINTKQQQIDRITTTLERV